MMKPDLCPRALARSPLAALTLAPSRTIALLLLAGLNSAALAAQEDKDGLHVSGAVRLRYEAIDGQARTGFNRSDDLVNLRTNVLAEYRHANLRAGVEVYDSRVWGDDSGTPVSTGEVNALEPVQAYVAADFADALGKGSNLALSAGRMTLNMGSRRLVAADDYRNTTSGYTGVRAQISAQGGWKADLAYMLPQYRLPDDSVGIRSARVKLDRESRDAVLWGGTLSKAAAIGPALAELSYFRFEERDSPRLATRNRSLDTFGGRLLSDPRAGGMDFEAEAFYQSGNVNASLSPVAPRLDVSAGFLHLEAGYTFKHEWKPHLAAEFDLATGDKSGGKYARFDTLFGMRRADLAPSGLYNAVGRANILAQGFRLEATPSKNLDWFVAYRALWLASDEDSFSTTGVRDPSGESGSFAGHQIEGRVRYWIVPSRLRFEFDGVMLAKGQFLRDAPNATPGRNTVYGSLNLTASF